MKATPTTPTLSCKVCGGKRMDRLALAGGGAPKFPRQWIKCLDCGHTRTVPKPVTPLPSTPE